MQMLMSRSKSKHTYIDQSNDFNEFFFHAFTRSPIHCRLPPIGQASHSMRKNVRALSPALFSIEKIFNLSRISNRLSTKPYYLISQLRCR